MQLFFYISLIIAFFDFLFKCYGIIWANSANDNMAKGSAIISPFGNIIKDDNKTILEAKFDKDEILKVRKYIDIGLN